MDSKVEAALKFIGEQLDRYHGNIPVLSSFGKDSMVVLHLVMRIKPDVEVWWVKPPFLPKETLDFSKLVQRKWKLQLLTFESEYIGNPTLMQDIVHGPQLWKTNPQVCYPRDTEILTHEGWKDITEITELDMLATMNPESEELEYLFPVKVTSLHYEGKLHRQQGSGIDISVTPDHNLWVGVLGGNGYMKTKEWKWVSAKDCQRRIKMRRDVKWTGKEEEYFILSSVGNKTRQSNEMKIPMDMWLKFIGIWLTEGSITYYEKKGSYIISISQKPNTKSWYKIQEMLEEFPIHFGAHGRSFRAHNKQLYEYLKQFGHSKNKYIPRELLQLSKRQLTILFEWLMLGDGNKNGLRFAVASKQFANDFHELVLKIGKAGSYKEWNGGFINTRMHTIEIANKRLQPMLNNDKDNRSLVDYCGEVYYIQMPTNHLLYVRQNGKACWCGNCCEIFKVKPSMDAVKERGVKAWFSGMRNTESEKRSLYTREWKQGEQAIIKLHPIIDFTEADVWRYTAVHNLPVHPWYRLGYRSLGCKYCSFPNIWHSERGGRWANTMMEGGDCGIHCVPMETKSCDC